MPINRYRSLGLFSRRQIDDIFFLFFPENRIKHFVQTICMKSRFLKKKKKKKKKKKTKEKYISKCLLEG